ncbi:hypothetical protein EDB87DRAFT_1687662 [Lactarius vividus]|nr:hypothetical protein EDB87DRAFT_1687662 [Lactarius vividus]
MNEGGVSSASNTRLMHFMQARYDFIFTLIVFLFSLTDNPEGWDPIHRPQNSDWPTHPPPVMTPSLLSEIFAVFRSVAMPRYSAEQPAFNAAPFTLIDDADGSARSAGRAADPRSRCLICFHACWSCSGTAADAPFSVATHAFLDISGLL